MGIPVKSPLFTIAIIIIVIIFIIIIYNWIAKKNYFICPKCDKRFKASGKQLMLTIHVWDKFYLKCPNCQKRQYMKQMKDK